jgi:hypothetical protein
LRPPLIGGPLSPTTNTGVTDMTTHNLTIRYKGGLLTDTIEANHALSYYPKHYPYAGNLDAIHEHKAHAENKLATLRRTVEFMDKYGVVSCSLQQSSLEALSSKHVPMREDQLHSRISPVQSDGWDHVSYWRRPGDKVPTVVITEPYHINNETVRKYLELAHRLCLEFEISNKFALWNPPGTTAVLWHRAGEHWWSKQPAAEEQVA